jgi:hypothetical protein
MNGKLILTALFGSGYPPTNYMIDRFLFIRILNPIEQKYFPDT